MNTLVTIALSFAFIVTLSWFFVGAWLLTYPEREANRRWEAELKRMREKGQIIE